MIVHHKPTCAAAWAASLLAALLGCDKVKDLAGSVRDAASQGADQVSKSVSDAAQDLKQGAQKVGDKVGAGLELVGTAELTLDAPVQTKMCLAKFIPSQVKRPSVLQFQSYRDPQQETFPSVFARAQISAGTLAELNGQTIGAQLYVQPQKDGPTWYTPAQLVQLKITTTPDKQLTAEIVGGSLTNTGTGVAQPVKGVLRAVLQ